MHLSGSITRTYDSCTSKATHPDGMARHGWYDLDAMMIVEDETL